MDRPSSPNQNEKRRLKRVLGVVPIAEDAPADTQDHRPMALDERGKCELGDRILAPDKQTQKLPVRQSLERSGREQRLDLLQECTGTTSGHLFFPRVSCHTILTMRPNAPPVPTFSEPCART